MIKRLSALFVALGLMLALSAPAFAAIDVYQFNNPKEQEIFQELTSTLRCPQCQNNTIADSDAKLAGDMRLKVLQMLNEGKSKQEIINYMVERYGYFIDYNPPVTSSTLILWLGPLGAVIIGFIVLVIRSRRTSAVDKAEVLDTDEAQRLKVLLDEMEKNNSTDDSKVK